MQSLPVLHEDGTVFTSCKYSLMSSEEYSAQLEVRKKVGDPNSATIRFTSLLLRYQYWFEPRTVFIMVQSLFSSSSRFDLVYELCSSHGGTFHRIEQFKYATLQLFDLFDSEIIEEVGVAQPISRVFTQNSRLDVLG